MKPQAALVRLMEGNQRFTSGVRSVVPLLSNVKMKELAEKGQKPFAIVLTCSDSRSPVEMIFDQGIGDVFVVRVAGNVIAPSLLASIEFAAANFGSPLIMVLGHTHCGAVKATLQKTKNPSMQLPSIHLEELVSRITPAVEKTLKFNRFKNEEQLLYLCAEENVRHNANLILEQSKIIKNLVQQGKVEIVCSVLEIDSGKVRLLKQPSNVKSIETSNPIWNLA